MVLPGLLLKFGDSHEMLPHNVKDFSILIVNSSSSQAQGLFFFSFFFFLVLMNCEKICEMYIFKKNVQRDKRVIIMLFYLDYMMKIVMYFLFQA